MSKEQVPKPADSAHAISSAIAIQRPTCPACLRPQSACICQWVTPIPHPVRVLILQHLLEVHNPKGSARLLHLSLPGSRLAIGETFDDLPALLTQPCAGENLAARPRLSVLLYPQTPQDKPQEAWQFDTVPEVAAPGYQDWHDPAQLQLVVLDGTWRKSRKMLHCNPQLLQLPRLTLKDMPASRYLIRKAHQADQLSTLEATCAALAQMHGGSEQFTPLLAAFDGFVAQQLRNRSR